MNQLTQQLKTGNMEIIEVPFPALSPGNVLVRNHYSVISAGTEGKTVSDARKGYIAKARSRQKEVKQVIEMIKTTGLLSTYKTVMNKLEAPSPLGYSSAGEVIAIGEKVKNFKVGDYVSCGGATASHADVISVPENLCCKVPKQVNLEEAAFATIAAIAIQGIRQADLRAGENCVIIGMGLIGQLTAQVLEAAGILPIGIDISEQQVEASKMSGIKHVFNRNQQGLEEQVQQLTNGHGTDAVIITAGSSSLDPVEFAGIIARRKAKVVIVGAVPTGFSRQHYYRKELDLRMSCSYGPGRYDPAYEEKGIDYPIGYVRFTEQRNMQTFIQLLESEKLNISKLITHRFALQDAPGAYSMILDKSEHFAGIIIQYDHEKELIRDVSLKQVNIDPAAPNIGMIGAGNFAQNILLPRMKGLCNFVSIATMQGTESIYVAKKYGFSKSYENTDSVINDENVNTLFVLTRHDTHADFILKGIRAGKHVYTEKPLAMTETELEEIKSAWVESRRNHLMLGFNRRFSPATRQIKKLFLDEQPKAINIRVNAGVVPPEHWVNDPEIGGGRIIGEACHFIDLAMFLAGAKIIQVAAAAMNDAHNLNNSVIINLGFENGSIASVNYFSNGNKKVPKEQIEVFCGGTVARIDDFKTLAIHSNADKKIKLKGQDKGHTDEMKEFLNSIRNGQPCPIPFEESYLSTLATFKVIESLKANKVIYI
jgi:predicted dehydrogenase/threonine dehydrogenase-like Zn-dependent dehydrogenase